MPHPSAAVQDGSLKAPFADECNVEVSEMFKASSSAGGQTKSFDAPCLLHATANPDSGPEAAPAVRACSHRASPNCERPSTPLSMEHLRNSVCQ